MQIPFTSFNFSALAKDIDSFFRTQCSGEFPPDCGPELVTSAGPEISPGCYVLALVFERLSLAGAAPVEPGPTPRLNESKVRNPDSEGNQMHSSIVWTLRIPKM